MPCVSITMRTARNELITGDNSRFKVILAIQHAELETNETKVNKVKCSLITLTNKNLRWAKTIGMENRRGVGGGMCEIGRASCRERV